MLSKQYGQASALCSHRQVKINNMNKILLGCAMLPMCMPLFANTPLHDDKPGTDIELVQRQISNLEKELGPMKIDRRGVRAAATDEMIEDGNRALERALVSERSLLLSAGASEVELNFAYSHRNDHSANIRRDAYGPGIALKVGLPGQTQVEIAAPYVFERQRTASVSRSADGIGDVSIGISRQLISPTASLPGVIGSLQYQAATGKNTSFTSDQPVALGSGFRSVQGSLVFLKRMDPLIFFGNYSLTHYFPETNAGIEIAPGKSHGVRFGTALATSPDTSLRTALNLNFYNKTRVNRTNVSGSDDTTAMFEIGGSVVLSGSTALDLLVGLGATRNTPDFRINAALMNRF